MENLIKRYQSEGRVIVPKQKYKEFKNRCAEHHIKYVVSYQDNADMYISNNDAMYQRLISNRAKTALTRIICKIEGINAKNKLCSIKEQQNDCLKFVLSMHRLYGITMPEIKRACRQNNLDCSFMF